jgi:hypothetical protein
VQLNLSRAQWRKSRYSGNSGNCVEVAHLNNSIAVRDSKNSNSQALSFTSSAWATFIRSVKHKEFEA